jgi:hypothetical protein
MVLMENATAGDIAAVTTASLAVTTANRIITTQAPAGHGLIDKHRGVDTSLKVRLVV